MKKQCRPHVLPTCPEKVQAHRVRQQGLVRPATPSLGCDIQGRSLQSLGLQSPAYSPPCPWPPQAVTQSPGGIWPALQQEADVRGDSSRPVWGNQLSLRNPMLRSTEQGSPSEWDCELVSRMDGTSHPQSLSTCLCLC